MILHLSIDITADMSPDQVEELLDSMLMQLDNTNARMISSNVTGSRAESFQAAAIVETPVPKRTRPYISIDTARIAVKTGRLSTVEDACSALSLNMRDLEKLMRAGQVEYEVAKMPNSSLKRYYIYTNSIKAML